jgi:hypothetical protein
VVAVALTSCSPKDSINPDDYLTLSQKDAVKTAIIRYVSRLPDGVKQGEQFDKKYDEFYTAQKSRCLLEFYAEKDQYHYFVVTQPAPSLKEKRHATAGRFILNDDGDFVEYEEIFRTWKMEPDELRRKSEILFRKLLSGESLEPYYTKRAADQYIEFPDDRNYFDKTSRSWKTK